MAREDAGPLKSMANSFSWLLSRACRRSGLAVWLASCAGSLLAATPVSVVLRAATSDLPRGEAAIFESGGTWLLEVLNHRADALSSSIVTSAWILVAFIPLWIWFAGALWSALWLRLEPDATFSDALLRGAKLLPRMMTLWVLTRAFQGLVLVLGVLIGRTCATVVGTSVSERSFDLLVLAGGVLGLSLAGLVQLSSWLAHARLAQSGMLVPSLVWGVSALRRGALRLALGAAKWEGAGFFVFFLSTCVVVYLGNTWSPMARGFLHQLGFLLATVAHVAAIHSVVEWMRVRSDDLV